jgi:cephalosporin-C deacetylase
MPWFDLPLEQLREYRTDTAEPPELDRWWELRLDEARAEANKPTLTRHEADIYAPVEVYDTEFSGAAGDRIRAWHLRPAGADEQTPVVVKFIGYGGGRGRPAEHALLPALGYAVFVMDTRGQGGRWSTGATGDHPDGPGAGPENAQVMTRGIARPEGYYYTRLFTDAAMAVEVASELTGASRVAVSARAAGSRWPPLPSSRNWSRCATPTCRSSVTSSAPSPWRRKRPTPKCPSSSPTTWT